MMSDEGDAMSGKMRRLAVGMLAVVLPAWVLRAVTPATEPDLTWRLWEGDAPGALGKAKEDIPGLTIYRPAAARANGAAVIVCPGGGYGFLAPHEATPVAQWLNTIGVTALVLQYRLGPKYHHPAMLEDVTRAVRVARSRATELQIDANRIGLLGFSAGGHLASTALTHFEDGKHDAEDPIDRVSSRPDFGVLIYPVITLSGPNAHGGSRENLLGKEPPQELVDLLSNEKHVSDKTPPCFLVHSSDDAAVPFENSLMFAEALHQHHVPVELHVFDHGGHGFGMGQKDPVLKEWPNLCARWMESRGFFKQPETKPQ